MYEFIKKSEQPEWLRAALKEVAGNSLDGRVYVIKPSTGSNDPDYGVDIDPVLQGAVTLMNKVRVEFSGEFFLATQLERVGQAARPVCRCIVQAKEGAARFPVIHGRFGLFPQSLLIRSSNVIAILETPEAKLKSLLSGGKLIDPNGIYASLRAIEEWKQFYSSYARKNGQYWNWLGVSLTPSSRSVLAQASAQVADVVIKIGGAEYPFVPSINTRTVAPETPVLPFEEIPERAFEADAPEVKQGVLG